MHLINDSLFSCYLPTSHVKSLFSFTFSVILFVNSNIKSLEDLRSFFSLESSEYKKKH